MQLKDNYVFGNKCLQLVSLHLETTNPYPEISLKPQTLNPEP